MGSVTYGKERGSARGLFLFCLTHPNQRVAHSGHELSLCLPSEKPPRDEISLLVFVFAVTQAEDGRYSVKLAPDTWTSVDTWGENLADVPSKSADKADKACRQSVPTKHAGKAC